MFATYPTGYNIEKICILPTLNLRVFYRSINSDYFIGRPLRFETVFVPCEAGNKILNIYAVQQDTQTVSMSEFIQHLC